MNKQEVIEKLEYLKRLLEEGSKDSYNNGFINALKYTLNVVKQLKEQEKPKVPQFLSDWYKDNQDDFEYSLYKLCIDFHENNKLRADLYGWFNDDNNKSIETLVLMHQFGYEVEKEKLYTVELPNPNAGGHVVLCKTSYGIVSIAFAGMARWKGGKNFQLTESEIKEDFEWAWQFAKEVEE